MQTILDTFASIFNDSKEFRKVYERIPTETSETSPKLLGNLPTKLDGRRKPRTLKQIQAYKRNFENRHKIPPSKPVSKGIYDGIFS